MHSDDSHFINVINIELL